MCWTTSKAHIFGLRNTVQVDVLKELVLDVERKSLQQKDEAKEDTEMEEFDFRSSVGKRSRLWRWQLPR